MDKDPRGGEDGGDVVPWEGGVYVGCGRGEGAFVCVGRKGLVVTDTFGGPRVREVEPVTSTWRTVTRDSGMLRPSRIRDLTAGRSERAVAMRGCGEVCRRRRASARESPREDGTTILKGILKSECCVDIKRFLIAKLPLYSFSLYGLPVGWYVLFCWSGA